MVVAISVPIDYYYYYYYSSTTLLYGTLSINLCICFVHSTNLTLKNYNNSLTTATLYGKHIWETVKCQFSFCQAILLSAERITGLTNIATI